ncbi:head protein [Pseudomonas phage WP1]
MAFSVIGTQLVQYRKFEQRTKNSQAQYVYLPGEPFQLAASIQRVRRDQPCPVQPGVSTKLRNDLRQLLRWLTWIETWPATSLPGPEEFFN